MKTLFTALLVSAAIGAAGSLAAEGAAPGSTAQAKGGACSADIAQYCKDIKPGGGRIKACLAEHQKELSQACVQRLEKRAAKKDKLAQRRGGKHGGKGAFACAPEYERGFSRGFGRGYRMAPGFAGGKSAKAAFWKGAKACATDARELCKGVKPGEGRVQACLRQNLDKLSGRCKARQEKLLEREKKKEAAEKKA